MSNPTMDERTEERIEQLMDAQEKLREAVELIRQAMRGTPGEERSRRTIIATLEMATDSNHSWLGIETSVEDLIDQIRGDESDEG